MSMLLTISQPTKTEFGGRVPHDFSPRIPLAKSRLSPKPTKVDSPVSSLRVSSTPDTKMSAGHRGLPPPSAMTLPDPGRPPPSFHGGPFQSMPNPPNQWQGHEESMRSWLAAKAEGDKLKQEEEKTKQENYRLEQRRIEQTMLREALQAGVPPATVPMIYAGIGGSNLAHISNEWLQQYAAQLQATQQQLQQQQSSPELRRETRLIGQAPPSYPATQPTPHQVLPSQHSEQQSQQPASMHTTFTAYQPAPARPPPTSAPRSATHTQLPRLTTNDIYIHQQPQQQQGPGSAHPLQQSQTVHQDAPTSSPSIYFHHWVPPSESKSTQPQTPASKGDREPLSAIPGSHLSESDYKESPRKRKAQGPHQPAPPPSSAGGHYTSPSFSAATFGSASKRKTSHHRSASGAESDSRPDSSGRREQELKSSSQPESAGSSGEERKPGESAAAAAAAAPPTQEGEKGGRLSAELAREETGERPDSRGAR